MPRYYTHFAATFPFPKAAAEDLRDIIHALSHHALHDRTNAEQVPDWYLSRHDLLEDGHPSLDRLSDFAEQTDLTGISSEVSFQYYEDQGALHINNSAYCDVDALARVLADVMEEHQCQEPVVLEVAYSSDEPNPGEFGGEVYVVGPGIVESMGTGEMAERLWEKVERSIGARQSGMTPK